METKGSQSHNTRSSYRKHTLWYFSHWPLVYRRGVEATRALQAPSAWLVSGYVAMCSTWPHASAQRPFVVARAAGWGLPLIPGQLFISKGRGRAKKEKKINRKKRGWGWRFGGAEKKVNLCCQLLEKHQGLFCLCKEKEEKRGKGLSVSWRIVARRGKVEADLQEVITGGERYLSGC